MLTALVLGARLRWALGWAAPPLLMLVAVLTAARVLVVLARAAARLGHMWAVARHIPGPRLEHLLRLWRARRSPSRVSDLFHDVAQEQHDRGIFKFWSGPVLFVILMRADDMECVLTDKRVTEKSIVYDFLGTLMGEGLLHLSGERWRRRRRIVAPFFSPDVLRRFPAVFRERADVLGDLLDARARDGRAFDVMPYVGQAVTDMVCHTVMATDMDTRALEDEGIARAMNNAFAIILYRTFNPWFLSDTLFKLSAFYAYFKRSMDLFDAFTLHLLGVKRKEREAAQSGGRQQQQRPSTDEADLHSPRTKPTFLDVMLDTSEGAALSDAELLEETKTLITAATGGSTDALCFVLLCISLRQDVQDKIVQELSDVFGDDLDRVATMDDLRHLEYLERVIKETMRMFPSIPQYGRSISHDMELPSGYTLPAGAQVFVYTPAVQMDPRHFPEPATFDPDRFLCERSAGRHPYSYLPFGGGAHTCIGQRYALMQIKSTVSAVLRRYRLLPAGESGSPADIADVRTNLLVTQRARGGYRMRLRRRRRSPDRPTGQDPAADADATEC